MERMALAKGQCLGLGPRGALQDRAFGCPKPRQVGRVHWSAGGALCPALGAGGVGLVSRGPAETVGAVG